MTTKILVIGSNSFSGASFVNYSLHKGCAVIGISRSQPPNDIFLPYSTSQHVSNCFKFYQFDINHHIDQIIALVRKEKPEYIFNFAAQSMVAESWDYPEHWFMTNAVSTTKLFKQLKDCRFIKKYIHITTPEVYGTCATSTSVEEDMGYNPSTPYAVSRAAGDMSLKVFVDTYGFPAVLTRAANVYGPGQQLYRIIPRTMLYARLGKKLQLHGGGQSVRSFIHINDVSNATFKIALNGVIGETYHISTNETVSIKSLVQKICVLTKTNFEDFACVADERLGKDHAYLLNSSKLRSELAWSDQISLEQGLRETLAWVDKNLEKIKTLPQYYEHKP